MTIRSRASTSAGEASSSRMSAAPHSPVTTVRPPSVSTSTSGTVEPGRAQQPAGRAGGGQVAPGVQQQHVGIGGVEQRRRLDGQHPDPVGEQPECGEHLGRASGRRREQQQVRHVGCASRTMVACQPYRPAGSVHGAAPLICETAARARACARPLTGPGAADGR